MLLASNTKSAEVIHAYIDYETTITTKNNNDIDLPRTKPKAKNIIGRKNICAVLNLFIALASRAARRTNRLA